MIKKDIPVLCLYHNDGDGKCSAAIVDHFHPRREVRMHKMNYGYDTPWGLIKRAQKVYMVDYGLQPFSEMVEVKRIVGEDNFIWIDHHKTAIEDMENSGQTFRGIREIGKAGCELTWEWFTQHPDFYSKSDIDEMWARNSFDEMPRIVRMMGRYDVWDLDYDPDIMPIQIGMRFLDSDPTNRGMWALLLNNDFDEYYSVLEKGDICYQYQQQMNKAYCNSHSFDVEWEGYRFIAANCMNTNSQLFDEKFDPVQYDAMLVFGWSNGHWTFSMYTTKEGIDVGAIAKKYGGGGHVGAAGFQKDDIPFDLPVN